MKKQREKTAEPQVKRPFFTTTNFVTSVVCLVLFLAIGLSAYYVTAGEFVSAQLAAVYAGLALLGALAVLFRLYRFVGLYYLGCGIGWAVGCVVGGLKGAFAPTAGVICTGFFIAIFAVFGALAQWKGLRKLMARRKADKAEAAAREEEARQLEEEARQDRELDRARLERENAEALLHNACGVEDAVEVDTPAAALDQAARLAFAEEEPARLTIPAERLDPEGLDEGEVLTAACKPPLMDQPLPRFPEGAMPADPGPVTIPPETEKTAAAPVGAAAADADKQ